MQSTTDAVQPAEISSYNISCDIYKNYKCYINSVMWNSITLWKLQYTLIASTEIKSRQTLLIKCNRLIFYKSSAAVITYIKADGLPVCCSGVFKLVLTHCHNIPRSGHAINLRATSQILQASVSMLKFTTIRKRLNK